MPKRGELKYDEPLESFSVRLKKSQKKYLVDLVDSGNFKHMSDALIFHLASSNKEDAALMMATWNRMTEAIERQAKATEALADVKRLLAVENFATIIPEPPEQIKDDITKEAAKLRKILNETELTPVQIEAQIDLLENVIIGSLASESLSVAPKLARAWAAKIVYGAIRTGTPKTNARGETAYKSAFKTAEK